MRQSREEEIERYLRTGEYDAHPWGWPGPDFLERCRSANAALRKALIKEVRRRAPNATQPQRLADLDVAAFTRAKVAPMVKGLFARSEQETVLDVLGASFVFLTPATVDAVLDQMPWLGTAWDLANLYLAGCDAPLLAQDAPYLLGLSAGTRCYVSAEYFAAPVALRRFRGPRGRPYVSPLQAGHDRSARNPSARVAAGDRLRQTRDLCLRL